MTGDVAEILDSSDEIYELHTAAAGPAGALPLTEDMLRNWASGDLFGLSQDAGMGWNPSMLAKGVPDPLHVRRHPRRRRHAHRAGLSHRPLGGRPAHAGRRARIQGQRLRPVRRLLHRPVRRPHAGHRRA